jgi:CAAX protease family protein
MPHPTLLTILTLLILLIALPLFSMWAAQRVRAAAYHGSRLLRYARTIVILWSLTGLAVYALRLHHLDTTYVGLRPPRHLWELALGLVTLVAPLLASMSGTRRALEGDYAKAVRAVIPADRGQWIAFVPVAASAGICEEFLYRGYALTVIAAITGSVAAGVVFSSIAFGLGHAYQGKAGIAGTSITGLIYAGVFLATGSLYPCMIGHFVQDVVGAAMLSQRLSPDEPRAVAPAHSHGATDL